mmetsp:Transcript_33488/g.66178  ORF Transcript_33488/g.66178 Transcript_33488/m.66178 type:complete len:302 (+) Transcript_33488:301-1206(+)
MTRTTRTTAPPRRTTGNTAPRPRAPTSPRPVPSAAPPSSRATSRTPPGAAPRRPRTRPDLAGWPPTLVAQEFSAGTDLPDHLLPSARPPTPGSAVGSTRTDPATGNTVRVAYASNDRNDLTATRGTAAFSDGAAIPARRRSAPAVPDAREKCAALIDEMSRNSACRTLFDAVRADADRLRYASSFCGVFLFLSFYSFVFRVVGSAPRPCSRRMERHSRKPWWRRWPAGSARTGGRGTTWGAGRELPQRGAGGHVPAGVQDGGGAEGQQGDGQGAAQRRREGQTGGDGRTLHGAAGRGRAQR